MSSRRPRLARSSAAVAAGSVMSTLVGTPLASGGAMLYRYAADAVVVVHFAFVLYVAFGGFLAWKWPPLLLPHLVAAAYGAGIVVVGWICPLTPLEHELRDLGGEPADDRGFVDRWIEGVVYPADLTPVMRTLAGVAVAVSWAGAWRLHRRRLAERSAPRRGAPHEAH